MPSEINLFLFSIRTFTLLVALAALLCFLLAARQLQQRWQVTADVCLAALAGGLVGARVIHVLLQWSYFADNPGEAFRLNAGGLDWHGAVLGGLVGLGLVTRWRRLPFHHTLDALTPALPLLALASWVGCLAAFCGYGAEVATLAYYPAYAASETPDVYGIVAPRYNTQWFGIALAVCLLLIVALLQWRRGHRRGWLATRRFWLVLALLSLGMFAIGFFRGDPVPVIAGLRADQVLDLLLAVLSGWQLMARHR